MKDFDLSEEGRDERMNKKEGGVEGHSYMSYKEEDERDLDDMKEQADESLI